MSDPTTAVFSDTTEESETGVGPAEGASRSGSPRGEGRPARYDRRRPEAPTVTVVIPTYNERSNVLTVIDRVGEVLADFDYEILVVDDDSPDETWRVVEERGAADRRVRLLRRVGRRGLSSAVIDGMAVANGQVFAVMDADLQHDERALPDIISAVVDDGFDVCIGSREAPGGGYGSFGPVRRLISWTGAQMARRLLRISVGDPMSGFFVVSRARFDAVRPSINPRGFKVLLELVARGPRPMVSEIGYQFRERTEGETKLSPSVVLSFLRALVELSLSRLVSARFATFAAVSVTGHSIRLSAASTLVSFGYSAVAPFVAFQLAALFEFGMHRRATFRDVAVADRNPLAALIGYHLIALHTAAALAGVSSFLEAQLLRTDSGLWLASTLALVALAVIGTTIAGYTLAATHVWPSGPASNPENDEASDDNVVEKPTPSGVD